MKAKGDRTGIGQLSFLRVPLIMFVAAAASGQNREVWYRLSLSAAKAKDNGDFLQAKELAEAALTEARKFPQGDIRIADSLACWAPL